MAYIDDLIASVQDPNLRRALATELSRIKGRKPFGLVFERHIPETGVLPGLRPHKGAHVIVRDDPQQTYVVEELHQTKASLRDKVDGTSCEISLDELLVVATFGRPIYPALTSLGSIERSTDRPFHSVINGENYHALQLLTYIFPEQVDCIYIDPPYNTGSRDWTYNNRFVDRNDAYRHSKWLSFMEKRLRLARRLLKPDGVLVVTIDEHEVHHLGLLLEDLFPERNRQMVTIVINPKGVTQGGLSRVEEHAIFCYPEGRVFVGRGDDLLTPQKGKESQAALDEELDPATARERRGRWKGLLHSGEGARRLDRPNMFYPVLIDEERGAVVGAGEPLLPMEKEDGTLEWPEPDLDAKIDGLTAVWPIRSDGSWGRWYLGNKTLREFASIGYVALGRRDPVRKTWSVSYLYRSLREQIERGGIEIVGYDNKRNVVEVRYVELPTRRLKTVWHRSQHDAGAYGADLLGDFLGARIFSFPKSLYAVRDTLSAVVDSNPNALILDFFAGSGTTLHATCLLNQEDGGRRRCILVTNNEVDAAQREQLRLQGYHRGSVEYESRGVFEAVTRPRCEATITGTRPDGHPVAGKYLSGRPYADGFEENVEFFRLDYLEKDDVELGRAFTAINPCLWLMSGSRGSRRLNQVGKQGWAVAEGGAYAVLFDETQLRSFKKELACSSGVERVFLVTDSEEAYAEMTEALGGRWPTSMLYRDYLRNFHVSTGETQ